MANNRRLAFPLRTRHVRCVCTVVALVRPDFVLLAANRDERLDRPWDPPSAWWPEHPGTVAGRDRMAGGTWMGMNRSGVVATGPEPAWHPRTGTGQAQPRRAPVDSTRPSDRFRRRRGDYRPRRQQLARLQYGAGGSQRGDFHSRAGSRPASGGDTSTGCLHGYRLRPERPEQPAHRPSPTPLQGCRTQRTGRLGRLASDPGGPDRRAGGTDQRCAPWRFRNGLRVICLASDHRQTHMEVRSRPPARGQISNGLLRLGYRCYTRRAAGPTYRDSA